MTVFTLVLKNSCLKTNLNFNKIIVQQLNMYAYHKIIKY